MILTHLTSKIAADIFDAVKKKLGTAKASRWMFSANADLAGRSPIEALRHGDVDLVKAAMSDVKRPPRTKVTDPCPVDNDACPF